MMGTRYCSINSVNQELNLTRYYTVISKALYRTQANIEKRAWCCPFEGYLKGVCSVLCRHSLCFAHTFLLKSL